MGLYSRVTMDAIKLAELYQAHALMAIDEAFGVERPEEDPHELTRDEYMAKLQEAFNSRSQEQMDSDTAELILQSLQQLMAMQQQGANGGGTPEA